MVVLALAFVAIGAGLGFWLRLAPSATAERPLPTLALYVQDAATGTARLATLPAMNDAWTRSLFDREPGPTTDTDIPALGQTIWRTEPAPPVQAEVPQITVSPLPGGRYQIQAVDPGARELSLVVVSDQALSNITLMGRPIIAPAPGSPLILRWADPSVGFSLILTASPGSVLHWAAIHDGWPDEARPLPRRSAEYAPFGYSDSLVVTGEVPLMPPG